MTHQWRGTCTFPYSSGLFKLHCTGLGAYACMQRPTGPLAVRDTPGMHPQPANPLLHQELKQDSVLQVTESHQLFAL